jgi:NADPH:quinone reductase-like Zn-dependent oxidoreductase
MLLIVDRGIVRIMNSTRTHPLRIGQRVWVFGAQSYRPFGTASELTVMRTEQAVELPDQVSDEVGACLGIPGITAHRAVFGDGAVSDMICKRRRVATAGKSAEFIVIVDMPAEVVERYRYYLDDGTPYLKTASSFGTS